MGYITTSQHVLELAETKKTHAKLRTVAKAWNLEYIDMYKEWKHLCCSRDFLISLSALSTLVRDYEQAQRILADCKKERMRETGGGRKDWTLSDVKSAVSRAREEGYVQGVTGTARATDTDGVVRETEVAGRNTPDSARQEGRRKRTRSGTDFNEAYVTPTLGSDEASVQGVHRAAGRDGFGNARARRLSDVAGTLVDLFDTDAHGYVERRKQTTRTPGTTSQQLPLTPTSAAPINAEPCPIFTADIPDCSSSSPGNEELAEQGQTFVSETGNQEALEDQSIDPLEAHHALNGAKIFEDTQEIILRAGAPPEWTNDDRIDVLLQSFNPDPSVWYIAPTQTLDGGRAADAALPDFPRAGCLPKMVVIPMRGAGETQHSLIILDRTRANCIVFDATGSSEFAEIAWKAAKDFFARAGVLQRDTSVDFDSFLSVHPSEEVSHGILLIIRALNQLHEKEVSRVSPRLWRILLAGFFPGGCETSQERLSRLLVELTNTTSLESTEDVGIERMVEYAESIDAAKSKAQSYVEETKLLLAMIEFQLQRREQRKQLNGVYEWLSAKPDHASAALDHLASLGKTQVESELRTLPEMPDQCEHQLHVLRTVCQHAATDCERAVLGLEVRRNILLEKARAKYELLGVRLMSLHR